MPRKKTSTDDVVKVLREFGLAYPGHTPRVHGLVTSTWR